ncbi:MAG: AarF/UbiB family protein [Rhizobium sp.]|nr:AarF/UbiB family protein [Rhizobium sp.]
MTSLLLPVKLAGRCVTVMTILATTALTHAPRWAYLLSVGRMGDANFCLGEGIARSLERLGPVFLKMGQMVSNRIDLLPTDLLRPLRRIQDQVSPEQFEISRATLERSLDLEIAGLFLSLEAEPVAAGSIATIYRAKRHDGREVAVKIVRRDVSRILESDLLIGSWLARVLARFGWFRAIPVAECYREIEALFRAQLDMKREASNLEAMRNDSFIHRHVRIPQVHWDLVDSNVLVMEYVGDALNISDNRIAIEAYRRSAQSILAVLYRMAFETGSVHCDMHPGNILLDGGGQVWLLDGGFFAHLSERDRTSFQDLFLGLSFAEPARCCDGLIRSAIAVPQYLDRVELNRDVDCLLSKHHGKNAGSFLVAAFVFDLFMLQRRHGLYARSGFIAAIWAFVTFEGIVRDRFPELDFQGEAKPFVVSGIIRSIRGR